MSGTWWVGHAELDDDQRKVISLSPDESFLVTGPPGSGKTNLLLLRANYLHLKGHLNIVVVTFTRSLREFIASGAGKYDFPASKIMTCREWQNDFLRQYGASIPTSVDFETDRMAYLLAMQKVVRDFKLTKVFEAILLDEAQDYLPAEIEIFSKLTERLFCVADERQKIYDGEESIETIKCCVDASHTLKFHYRNGINICRVADEIAKKWNGYQPLAETSNYVEKSNPSTVDVIRCKSIEEQASMIIERLGTQMMAFPDQLIGVLCPTKDSMQVIWGAINASAYQNNSFLLHGKTSKEFPLDKQVLVSTFHAAKGLEFRALHLADCDTLKSFGNNRRMVFTAVTRAKTALSIYHGGNLHSYFEAALNSLQPAPKPPSMDDIFGGLR